MGKRVLVVGASSGIGRAIAIAAVRAGAHVAFCARRRDALEQAVAEAGGGAIIAADLEQPDDCERIAREAAAALGGIDAVCYAAAMSPLRMLADTTAADWQRVLATNLVGASLVTRASLAYVAPGAVFSYLSSEGAGRPRHGLVAYTASKAALEEMIRGWRVEHPELRFVNLVIGATEGTDFAAGFDAALALRLLPTWVAHGEMHATLMRPDAVAAVVVDHLASALANPGVDVQQVVLRPPGPLMTDVSAILSAFGDAAGGA